jgi:hypothetical protein
MELHESLAQLARDHGESLFTEADAFRGALDDYLDEGSASTGTINLLTDAVRLGALQGMITMLDSGASVEDAVESAGQRLSRDRGSADVAGSQWACAVLGYALGKVPVSLAARLRPDAYTAEPPSSSASGTTARPSVSPGHAPVPPTEISSPPQQSPTQQWPTASPSGAAQHQPSPSVAQPSAPLGQPQATGQYGAPASPYAYTATPGYGTPPPKKSSSSGLIIGAIAAVVILGVVAIIAIIALSGGGDDPSAEDDTSASTSDTGGTTPVTTPPTTPVTTDPALTLRGSGYSYQFPNNDWKDLTSDTPDTTGTIDTIAAPGNSISTARGNILVETSSAYGETDVKNLKEDWKRVLQGSTGGTPVDIESTTIGGKEAVGVEIKWTNANDFDVYQIAYLVISGDEQYSITASFAQGDSGFKDTYYSVLDTWVWEE